MKKKRVIKVLVFVLCFVLMISALNVFLNVNNPNNKIRIQGFYREPKNSLDTIFIGASEIHTGFIPAQAYKNNGFTSYLLSVDSLSGNMYQSVLEEALSRQNPKLVVIEINGFLYNDENSNDEGTFRRWIDNLPYSENKIQTINKLVPFDQRYSYIIPLFEYHLNWMKFANCIAGIHNNMLLNKRGYSYLKGFVTFTNYDSSTKFTVDDKYFTDENRQNLIDLLNFCKEKKLKNVLFVRWPHKEVYNYSSEADQIERYVDSYGYDFINLNNSYNDINLDILSDFYNTQHMNIFGAEKYTDYFASYIKNKYDLNESHTGKVKKEWDTCAKYIDKFENYCEAETKKKSNKFCYEPTNVN